MNMREKIAERIRLHTTDAKWTPEGLADAALDALMEPTEGMLDAAPASHSVSFQAIWPKICGDVFTAMIRAAKEGK